MSRVYFNEIDPFAAEWLGNLFPDATIDTRSISDVRGTDLRGFDRVHFFAGIGGWEYACRLAGWPDDRPLWTGSCPCQPFSAAGKRKGEDDARHLWPEMRRLVAECRPAIVVGEQVAGADGRRWLAGVRSDLEEGGYAVGAADLCAAGVGAPHIRQRLYWCALRVGDPLDGELRGLHAGRGEEDGALERRASAGTPGERVGAAGGSGRVAHHHDERREGRALPVREGAPGRDEGEVPDASGGGADGRVAVAERDPRGARRTPDIGGGGAAAEGVGTHAEPRRRGATRSPWSRTVLIPCADGKLRRVPAREDGSPEPRLFPLAHGVPGRVGRLRAYGNAIVPQVAAEWLTAARAFFAANP